MTHFGKKGGRWVDVLPDIKNKLLFSKEAVEQCIATDDQVAEAKEYGMKMVSIDLEGTITGYYYQGRIFITDIEVNLEHNRKY